jgi:hypothetical protein
MLDNPRDLKHSLPAYPGRLLRAMESLPDLLTPPRRPWTRWRWAAHRRRANRPLAGALLTMMVAAMLMVSAVSPVDDATQPEFAQHKFSRSLAKDRASHSFPEVRILLALVPAFHPYHRTTCTETILVSDLPAVLAGFAAIGGARSPPHL